MKKLIVALLLSSLTACGTVAGFGNDISGAANWTKDKMTGDSK
jgi:predicted small secreted protein